MQKERLVPNEEESSCQAGSLHPQLIAFVVISQVSHMHRSAKLVSHLAKLPCGPRRVYACLTVSIESSEEARSPCVSLLFWYCFLSLRQRTAYQMASLSSKHCPVRSLGLRVLEKQGTKRPSIKALLQGRSTFLWRPDYPFEMSN